MSNYVENDKITTETLATRARNLKAYALLFSTPCAFTVDTKYR